MGCPNESVFFDVLLDETASERRDEIERHVASCDRCRSSFDQCKAFVGDFRKAPQADPPPWLRRKIVAGLREAVRQERPWYERALSLLHDRRLVPVIVGAAALFGFAVGLGTGPFSAEGQRAEVPKPPVVEQPAVVDTAPPVHRLKAVFGSTSLVQEKGTELALGETIRVEGGSRVEIDWKDCGVVHVDGPAVLELADASIELERGQVWCSVKPGAEGFAVQTPHLLASVVGTVFRVEEDADDSEVEVFGGRVRVRDNESGDEQTLGAGQQYRRGQLDGTAGQGAGTTAAVEPPTDTATEASQNGDLQGVPGQAGTIEEGF